MKDNKTTSPVARLKSPVGMRTLFIVIALLLIALEVGVVIAGKHFLGNYATEVSKVTTKSKSTQKSLDNLAEAKRTLKDHKKITEKAKNIVAQSKSYKYQNQVISDLNTYASQTGVSIQSFAFIDAAASKEKPKTKSSTDIAGVGSARITISLDSPLPYDNLMRFLSLMELNVTRMQVTALSISAADVPEEESNGKSWVNVPTITIEVYLQK